MTAVGQIRSFVERIERIEGEIKEFNDDKRDVYAEAKSSGFDIPALKAVIARRRKDPSKLTEHESLVETYEAALGTPVATRVHAQELAAQSGDDLAIPAFLDRRQA